MKKILVVLMAGVILLAGSLNAFAMTFSQEWGTFPLQNVDTHTSAGTKAVQDILDMTFGQSLAIDGSFGPLTAAAVLSFQIAKNCYYKDGRVGPETWPKLYNNMNNNYYPTDYSGTWYYSCPPLAGISLVTGYSFRRMSGSWYYSGGQLIKGGF